MAPETRSRGVPPPSRIYNSTPSLQQMQFKARRKTVRHSRTPNPTDQEPEGEENEHTTPLSAAAAALKLKQQTLTQLDFVTSSFEEGYDGLDFNESDHDITGESSKENKRPKTMKKEVDSEDDEDQPPVSSRRRKRRNSTKVKDEKRRRTLGDGEVNRIKDDEDDKKSRRRTLGDVPSSKSRYHTQTLTQFIGRDFPLQVLDSDDEGNNLGHDPDFDAWLGEDEEKIPSSSPIKPRTRQESIIPQTPTKPIRTEIPSSSQQVTPLSGIMLERYGAPNATQVSPSSAVAARRVKLAEETVNAGPTPVTGPPIRKKLVIEDSYTSELPSTPSKSTAERTTEEVEFGDQDIVEVASSTPGRTPRPQLTIDEMPTEKSSTVKRVRISSASPLRSSPRKVAIAEGRFEIPDSEEEDEDYEDEPDASDALEISEVSGPEPEPKAVSTQNEKADQQETFPAGAETQFVMDQMAVQEIAITSSPPLRRITTTTTTTTTSNNDFITPQQPPSTPHPKPSKPLRRPLTPPAASTQPFESQRLPTHLVQSFPPANHRSDAIVPISPQDLSLITSGHKISLTLPFQMLDTVSRFWFWAGTEIKYGASMGEAIHREDGKWEYPLPQVYELNNPLDEAELTMEGILCRKITRCGYMPPSIASGMLWNVARTLFPEGIDSQETQDDSQAEHNDKTPIAKADAAPTRTQGSTASGPGMTVSQEVEAQLQSDIAHSTQFQSDQILVPSTPEDYEQPPATPRPQAATSRNLHKTPLPAAKPLAAPIIRPSQATTASQCSTPSPIKPSQPSQADDTPVPLSQAPFNSQRKDETAPPPFPSSSSGLTFQDYSAPSPIGSHFLVPLGSSSQLLSKSQMLPDSLLREDDDSMENLKEA
ncbi:hypothetical protein CC79DRAFT_1360454 [Sarocladium strictum]